MPTAHVPTAHVDARSPGLALDLARANARDRARPFPVVLVHLARAIATRPRERGRIEIMAADARAIDGDVADAVAALERRYEGLKKKTTAVYEAKLVMARNAVKRAERTGDGNVDALRGETRALEARRDAALVDLDDELTRESGKTREEMEAEAREESVRRERAELVVRHLEEERAKAGEAEARRRPAARTREEEEELHEEAEKHRSRSPEGTSPREVGDEDARVEGLSAFGRMKRNLSKQPETRRPVQHVAEVVEEARARGAPPPETRRPVQHVAEVVEEARARGAPPPETRRPVQHVAEVVEEARARGAPPPETRCNMTPR